MLYAFTDESYLATSYLQGAFVIDESDRELLDVIVNETSEFAQRFGISPGRELRGYSIMNSKHGWEPLREKFHARVAIYKFLLTKVAATDGKLLFTKEIPSISHFERLSNYSRHFATHNQMLEQLNQIGEQSKKEIVIYADEITAQRKLALDFTKQKPRYKSLEFLHFVDSGQNSGVQIIDAILYLYQRCNQISKVDHRSDKVTLEMWDLVRNLLIK